MKGKNQVGRKMKKNPLYENIREPDDRIEHKGKREVNIEEFWINPSEEEIQEVKEIAEELPRGETEYIKEGTTEGEPIIKLTYTTPRFRNMGVAIKNENRRNFGRNNRKEQ